MALSRIKRIARSTLLRHSALNPALRLAWRAATLARPQLRPRLAVIGRFRVHLPDGGTLILASRGEDWAMTSLYWNGLDPADIADLRIFRRLARQSRIILDIGANVGLYALAVARDDPTREVHAFEPMPANHALLSQLITANRTFNIQPHLLAISDTCGPGAFYVPRNGAANVRDGSIVPGFRSNCDQVPVTLTTLDAFVARRHLRTIGLIKIDVESAEYLVLRGAAHTLGRDRPILMCEVLRGTTEDELRETLLPHRYDAFWISPRGLVEDPALCGDPIYAWRNYLLVPEEKRRSTLHLLSDVAPLCEQAHVPV